jgi:hypothetical protein
VVEAGEEYTPGRVWSILCEGSDDPDEVIDVQIGLSRLPQAQSAFLRLLSWGYSGREAMRAAGLRGNQTEKRHEALRALVRALQSEGK